MNVKLPPSLERFVQAQVKCGRYRSSDAIVRRAVALLKDCEPELAAIRAAIDESRAQLRRGQGIPLSEISVARVRQRASRRYGPPRKRKAS